MRRVRGQAGLQFSAEGGLRAPAGSLFMARGALNFHRALVGLAAQRAHFRVRQGHRVHGKHQCSESHHEGEDHMAVEIERKFLVADIGADAAWRTAPGVAYGQGYLNQDKERTVRVRIAGNVAYLTIKGVSVGVTRAEFEYPIPVTDAEALLLLCDGPLIEKTRHVLQHAGTTWEVDVFAGDNAGLVVAEVELQSESQEFEKPDWLGLEVTHEDRYFNSKLVTHPFSRR